MVQSKIYKTPATGTPLISTISTSCKTPPLEVKFCNLVKPYYYANSPTIPRHSVTCIIDPETHVDFLHAIQTIEKNEKVDTIIKNDTIKEKDGHVTTGKLLIKFQSKEVIPVYCGGEYPKGETPQMELEDELEKGEKIVVVYDILRYTKKNTMKTEHGLSFKPTRIYLIKRES